MKRSRILVTAVALALLLSGCGAKKPQAPEEYQDLFKGGSFDEYMVWTTDDEQTPALFDSKKTVFLHLSFFHL